MQNIVSYFNSFLNVIFGQGFFLSFSDCLAWLSSTKNSAVSSGLGFEYILIQIFGNPTYVFSFIVWFWFAWLTLHLLLIWPFKWLRSVVKR